MEDYVDSFYGINSKMKREGFVYAVVDVNLKYPLDRYVGIKTLEAKVGDGMTIEKLRETTLGEGLKTVACIQTADLDGFHRALMISLKPSGKLNLNIDAVKEHFRGMQTNKCDNGKLASEVFGITRIVVSK